MIKHLICRWKRRSQTNMVVSVCRWTRNSSIGRHYSCKRIFTAIKAFANKYSTKCIYQKKKKYSTKCRACISKLKWNIASIMIYTLLHTWYQNQTVLKSHYPFYLRHRKVMHTKWILFPCQWAPTQMTSSLLIRVRWRVRLWVQSPLVLQ